MLHLAHRTHGHAHAGGFQHQAGDAHQRAHGLQRQRQAAKSAGRLQVARPALRRAGSRGLFCTGVLRRPGPVRLVVPAAGVWGQPIAAACAQRDWRCARRWRHRSDSTRQPPRSTPGSAISRAPRACQHFLRAVGHQRQVLRVHVHGDVARRQQHRFHRLGATAATCAGSELQLAAQHLARQLHRTR
jgi:hypothetical protein